MLDNITKYRKKTTFYVLGADIHIHVHDHKNNDFLIFSGNDLTIVLYKT